MKHFISIILALVAALPLLGQADTWFVYPVPPENLPLGRPRANYIVEHFWDRCPWKQAYSNSARMEKSLRDFAEFLPHAAADTAHLSIDKLIKESSKKPADLAALLVMAEATFYSDTAYLFSDEVYLPFALAGAQNKKLAAPLREKYARQARVIESTSEGKKLPAISATSRNGNTIALNDTVSGASTYVIILEQPGDPAGRFQRVRFSANIAARQLISAGILKPILLATSAPSDDWWDSTADLPAQWTVAALPDADKWFDLRVNPAVYMLDRDMTVTRKYMPLTLLAANCEQIISNLNRAAEK